MAIYAALDQPSPSSHQIKYQAQILEIGEMVPDLLAAGVLIFFGSQAPAELREIAVIHDGTTLAAPVQPGDIIAIGAQHHTVTAVGALANTNLAQLGHIVIKTNGADAPELPGEVSVVAADLHIPHKGDQLMIANPVPTSD